jgi:hypothetical protein
VINQVEDSAQVVGGKNQSKISCGAFYGSLGHDIIKIPLAFYHSVWILHDGLTPAIYFIIVFDSYLVFIN